jgi:hypothetical protein
VLSGEWSTAASASESAAMPADPFFAAPVAGV